MDWQFLLILLCAVAILASGLAIYFRTNSERADHPFATTLISWLLIALFPVLVIFAFFPTSSANGTFFGISLTGAIAAFFLIWWWGTRMALSATEMDRLQSKIKQLERQVRSQPALQPAMTIRELRIQRFRVGASKKHVGVVSGELGEVKGIDVWVNSENTNLQMARYFDGSISGTIRYLGARKNEFGDVLEDSIGLELKQIAGGRASVAPSTVCVTGAGELANTHTVKRIFHVAAVVGEVSAGYRPVANIGQCVHRCLARAEAPELIQDDLKSMLIPLLGAGTRKRPLDELADELINAAIRYLADTPNCRIQDVYFLARTEPEWHACLSVLQASSSVRQAPESAARTVAPSR
ncbi:MAG: hypothetical protein JOZ81_01145 [Chloroflexi bacterium]|nr:hypothetical protein [Chloroflexota bacterium]